MYAFAASRSHAGAANCHVGTATYDGDGGGLQVDGVRLTEFDEFLQWTIAAVTGATRRTSSAETSSDRLGDRAPSLTCEGE